MFRIYRYLAIASGAAILAAMAAVAYFYYVNSVSDLVDLEESHNVAFGRVFSNAVRLRFASYIDEAPEMNRVAMMARPDFLELDGEIRDLTRGLSILKVKLYGANGMTIYSSELAQVGEDKSQEGAVIRALRDRASSSKFSRRDRFSAFSGEVFNRDMVETYVPITSAADRNVVGVFELYSDVTVFKDKIDHSTATMVFALAIVFIVLYGALVFVFMPRAIRPLHLASQRAAEIGPNSIQKRLPVEGMPSEVLPLIQSMNGALERLDRALEGQRRFSADAAHELLTPLAVLKAHLDTLGQDESIVSLKSDVDSMTQVVTQLLELAEFDARDPSQDEAVDLRDACIEVISLLAPLAVREKKSVSFDGPDDPILVSCARAALVRVLRNLIENGISHTPRETTVEVTLSSEGVVRVRDHGRGVPPEVRDRIFERFWRSDERKNRPGAGLGLSLVKSFASSYDGAVDVSDSPDGGALFTLRLPLIKSSSSAPN